MLQDRCAAESCSAPGALGSVGSPLRGSRLCRACARRLNAEVARLPALYRDCEDVLVAPRRRTFERPRGSQSGGISLNEAAVTVRARMLTVACSWAGFIADRRAVRVRPQRTMPQVSRFLLVHLPWLVQQAAVRDAFDELVAVAGAAEAILDTAGRNERGTDVNCGARPDSIEVGACDQPRCDGTVYATGGASALTEVRCDRGHQWPPSEWLLLRRRLRPVPGSDQSTTSLAGIAR